MQGLCFVICLSCQGGSVYNRGKAAKWDAQRAEENSGLRKGMASMRITLRIKGETDILRSTRTGLWEIILCQGRGLSCTRTVSCWNFWGWTLRRHRRSATRYGINRIQDEYKGGCAGDRVQGVASGQRCRKSSIMEPSPCGGLYPCGAAA